MIFHEDQWKMVLLMEQNVSLQKEREICSNYCVLYIQQMEVVLWRDPLNTLTQSGSNNLCMEEWFHDSNNKVEVINAQPQIAKLLWSVHQFFPRNTNTNGYNLPKTRGITKMQEYMKLFGSGINFYGGPGESAHKQFLKYLDREHSAE